MNDSISPDLPPSEASASSTILVAEDEPAIRALVVSVLANAGYRLLAANDGQHALDLARQYPAEIDLLLSDVMMPHLSGPELAAQLLVLRPKLRVMFMSGSSPDLLRQMVIDYSILHKPFTVAELLDAVSTVLAS